MMTTAEDDEDELEFGIDGFGWTDSAKMKMMKRKTASETDSD